jgi:hypothetical protein
MAWQFGCGVRRSGGDAQPGISRKRSPNSKANYGGAFFDSIDPTRTSGWLLFLCVIQRYDYDLILLALRPYVQRLSPGRQVIQ